MLRYTLSLTAPSEPLTSRVVRVKVGQVDRDPVGLNVNDPPSLLVYVVDGLQHGDNFGFRSRTPTSTEISRIPKPITSSRRIRSLRRPRLLRSLTSSRCKDFRGLHSSSGRASV